MRKMATIASFSVQFINQLTWHGEKPKKKKADFELSQQCRDIVANKLF